MIFFTKLLCAFLALFISVNCQITLEQYNVDQNSVTVSGISAGGAFATQYHVVHSSTIMGAAMFAGVIYHCANGLVATALLCMSSPYLTNENSLISKTEDLANDNSIDPVLGMYEDMVYIFAGTEDTVVKPANGPQIEAFYQHFGANIKTVYTIQAEHCQPTDFYGPQCIFLGGEYINNCAYNGAYEALNYMYGGNLIRGDASTLLAGRLSLFDQMEFFPQNDPKSYSMDDTGYIYVPSGCADKSAQCQLHVVFHGCEQGQDFLGDDFVTNTGYLQVGELNNIIILFPQVISEILINVNGNGCWDWWGYTGSFSYAKYEGVQTDAIKQMIDRLLYGI